MDKVPSFMQDLSYVKPAEYRDYAFVKPGDDDIERLKMISKKFSVSVDERSDDAVQVFLRVKPNEESSTVSSSHLIVNKILLK